MDSHDTIWRSRVEGENPSLCAISIWRSRNVFDCMPQTTNFLGNLINCMTLYFTPQCYTTPYIYFFYCFSLIYGVALILSCARENRETEPLGRVANLITIITLIEGEQTNNRFFFSSQSCNIEAWWNSNGEKEKKNFFLNLLWTASPWSSG